MEANLQDHLEAELTELRQRLAELEAAEAERKQVESSARISARQWRATFDAISDPISVLDAGGGVVRCNEALVDFVGRPRSGLEGRRCWDVLRGRAEPIEDCPYRRALESLERETAVWQRDNQWFEVTVDPMLDEDGYLIGFVHVLENITEAKQAEEVLRGREREIRLITDNAPALVSYVDADGFYRFVNERYEAWFEMPRGEIIGKHYREILGEDTYEAIREHVETALSGTRVRYEEALPYARGGTRWVIADYVPDVDDRGHVNGFFALVTDITERRQAEKVLRESEARYRRLFDSTLDAILIADDEARYVDVNPAACELLGYSRDELLDLTVWDVTPAEERDQGRQLWKEYLAAGEMAGEYTVTRKDGTICHADSRAVANVHPGLHMSVIRDITERKRAEEEVEQRNRELAALLDASRRLTGRLDLDAVLDAVAGSIVDALPAAEAASLWLYDEESDRLAVRAWAGHDDEAMAGLTVSPDAGLVGLIWRSGEPHVIDDASQEPAFERVGRPALDAARPERRRPDGSVIGVPLMIEDQLIGALFADSYSDVGSFGQSEVRLLQSLANQAAVALENARLYEAQQDARQRLRRLASYLQDAREKERTRIARLVHDELGQTLTALKFGLCRLARQLPEEGSAPRERVDAMTTMIDGSIDTVRCVCQELRPGVLDHLGLASAIEWQVEEFSQHTGIVCHLQVSDEDTKLGADVATALFRILQEALTNVARHARASEVCVELAVDPGQVVLSVADDGRGITEGEIASPRALGLLGIRERARSLGGEVTFEGVAEQGTTVSASIPRRDA